jgi:hypothetical protein
MKREKERAYEKPRDNDAQGISNRESPQAEAEERKSHPPILDAPDRQDAAEEPLAADDGNASVAAETTQEQTSSKVGSRSQALKEAGARYANRSMPATRKVAGAFGREPRRDETVSESQPEREQPDSK